MASPYRGLLLDLFGTLITFDATRIPEMEIGGQRLRTTVAALGPVLAEWAPETTLEAFLQALISVSEELARARAYDLIELPSRERFRRALERVGCDEGKLAEAAAHLSRAHMAVVIDATRFPPAHAELLRVVGPHHRIGLVSNFDDTAAAYEILLRHDIARHLDVVVVSEALGIRKPHPALVRAGLRGLGLEASSVLFVGDTFADDVGAAHAAGVDAAWIDARGAGVPEGAAPPRFVLRTLPELAGLLA